MNKNGHKTAVQEISDFAIAFVKSHEELTEAAVRTGYIEWRTVGVPHIAHMTVVSAEYNDDAVMLQINVSDHFAKRLNKEYVDQKDKGRGKEG